MTTVLKLLIERGANIDLRQREGCHELYEAAVFGDINAVDFFLEQGVDPSITNNFGWTPLHGAAANGHYEIVKRLIRKGVNISPLSDTYETPLSLTQNGETHYDSYTDRFTTLCRGNHADQRIGYSEENNA